MFISIQLSEMHGTGRVKLVFQILHSFKKRLHFHYQYGGKILTLDFFLSNILMKVLQDFSIL